MRMVNPRGREGKRVIGSSSLLVTGFLEPVFSPCGGQYCEKNRTHQYSKNIHLGQGEKVR